MSSTNPSDQDSETDASLPTYTHINAICPVCGNSRFETAEEGVPNGFDEHFVHATCARCRTHVTIEYRAIDVFWYDGQDGQHSAVSQGILDPIQTDYVDASQYSRLPDASVLDALNWPLECDGDGCEEILTGNDMMTDPETLATHGIDLDSDEADRVPFRCPMCEHITVATPASPNTDADGVAE